MASRCGGDGKKDYLKYLFLAYEKIIFGGVCATALFVSAAVSVISCSGDEECYKNGNYTLANKRVTRGAPEDPDGLGGTKVGSEYVKGGCIDGSIAMLDGKVVYNYRLLWSDGEMGDLKAYIMPTDGMQCNSGDVSYVDADGKYMTMQEIGSPLMSGLSSVGVHNGHFYLPNITLNYQKAKKKTVSYGFGYIYEYVPAFAGPYSIDMEIPSYLITYY